MWEIGMRVHVTIKGKASASISGGAGIVKSANMPPDELQKAIISDTARVLRESATSELDAGLEVQTMIGRCDLTAALRDVLAKELDTYTHGDAHELLRGIIESLHVEAVVECEQTMGV